MIEITWTPPLPNAEARNVYPRKTVLLILLSRHYHAGEINHF